MDLCRSKHVRKPVFNRRGDDAVPCGTLSHRKRRRDTMKKNTLVVLEQGNDCAFHSELSGCCLNAYTFLM